MNIAKPEKAYWPLILLLGIFLVYFYFFSFLKSDYSPYYGDEYFYYKNSENFYLTNSLRATFTYSGNGSRLLGTDAHGPAYPILYGSMAKILNWGGLTIPIVNTTILILAIVALLLNRESAWDAKLIQSLVIVGSPVTLFYAITYLPEILQIAGSVGLYLLLRNYLSSNLRKDFLILALYIFVLGSIRSTWFFAFFGLTFLPGPLKGFTKSGYVLLGLILPFLFQYFFHEQVPNTFSGLRELVETKGLWATANVVFFNIKRNIYFAFTYTEGYFYTLLKLWIVGSLILSLFFCRENKLLLFGATVLMTIMAFNIVLYKNYSWVDLRMYTPMALFLCLGMHSRDDSRLTGLGLLSLNLLSFLLILPLQKTLIGHRLQPDVYPISNQILEEIKDLEAPLVSIDSVMLKNYSITQLPVLTGSGEPIRYILGYYSMKTEAPTHFLVEECGQLRVKPVKILTQ